VLADKHPNAYPRHVKSVEEGLDIVVDLHPLPFALVLIDTLRNGCHHAVMPPLDTFESPSESLIVIMEFWWPLALIICTSIVSSRGTFASNTIAIAIAIGLL
jgi:hypothetical protein